MPTADGAPARPDEHGARFRWGGALALLLVLGLLGGAVTLVRLSLHRPAAPMAAAAPRSAAPLDLHTASDHVAEQYRFAAAHEAVYADIPCYCGCDQFLDHRNLYDCFVRADGRGWDAHAAGCVICVGESEQARRMLRAGRDPTDIRDAIIDSFGPREA